MASQGGSSRRSLSLTNASLQEKKKSSETHHGGDSARKSISASRPMYVYNFSLHTYIP